MLHGFTRRPTGINIFVKNTHQSEQLPPKEEVLLGNWVVKAKWLAVSFTSNISLKKIIWAFWRFYMYLRFKINIFKMQLLKNDTANLIDFNCFWSHFVSSFRKSCPLWCVILIKIHFQKIIGLVGHRALFVPYYMYNFPSPSKCLFVKFPNSKLSHQVQYWNIELCTQNILTFNFCNI